MDFCTKNVTDLLHFYSLFFLLCKKFLIIKLYVSRLNRDIQLAEKSGNEINIIILPFILTVRGGRT